MSTELTIRPVQVEDADNGFFEVLSQLTEAPKLPTDQFNRLLQQQQQSNTRLTLVAVSSQGRVQGTGSALIEPKFIRGGKACGHIEDIVIDKEARGAHVGQQIIAQLVQFCHTHDCYKVILDCSDHNVAFYEKCGFIVKGQQMGMYF